MSRAPTNNRERLGFRDGEKGTHSSRTLMLPELTQILAVTPVDADMAAFRSAVVEDNVLDKRSATTREHTVRKLKALYGLDPAVPIYRIMRSLWEQDPEGRPMLALLCATARDPLLRASVDLILGLDEGATIGSDVLAQGVSSRFSESTRRSIGQNLAATWMQAGFLTGVIKKTRVRAHATSGVAAYALALGHMEGQRGSLLLSTLWTRLLDQGSAEVLELVKQAARRGWVSYRAAGDVMDLRVDDLFTAEEREWCDGQPG